VRRVDGAASRLGVLRHPAPDAVVVLWHGRGPNEAHVLSRLAAALHDDGHTVVTPDWDAGSVDGGEAVLRGSLDRAAALADAQGSVPVLLAGWSLGGTAALSLALEASPSHELRAIVGLAAAPREQSPLNGVPPLEGLRPGLRTPSMYLVHGVQDTVVSAADADEFARSCLAAGIPCSLSLVDSDHAGVVGAKYDATDGICLPSDGPAAITGLHAAVTTVRTAAGR
jgi:predicted esterase